MRISKALAGAAIVVAGLSSGTALAVEDLANDRNLDQLVRRLDNAGVSLTQALRSVERQGGTPIRANFFVNDEGGLSLSIYTAEAGNGGRDAEHSVLREYRGAVSNGNWNPDNNRLAQDRVATMVRAAEHQTLMQMTRLSLQDIAERAADDGAVLWIQPRIVDGRAVFEVGLDDRGRATTQYYDLVDGDRVNLRNNNDRIRF